MPLLIRNASFIMPTGDFLTGPFQGAIFLLGLDEVNNMCQMYPPFLLHFQFPPSFPCFTSIFTLQSRSRMFYLLLNLSQLLGKQMNLFSLKSRNNYDLCLLVQDGLSSLPRCLPAKCRGRPFRKSSRKSIYFITIFNEMKISEVSLL